MPEHVSTTKPSQVPTSQGVVAAAVCVSRQDRCVDFALFSVRQRLVPQEYLRTFITMSGLEMVELRVETPNDNAHRDSTRASRRARLGARTLRILATAPPPCAVAGDVAGDGCCSGVDGKVDALTQSTSKTGRVWQQQQQQQQQQQRTK